jgi:phosphorylase kinase gamma subunit
MINLFTTGSYGAVNTVYNDDGEMFAMKSFDVEKEEIGNDNTDDDEDAEEIVYGTCELGTLREISVLRMFANIQPTDKIVSHPGIMPMYDATPMRDTVCIIMPKYACNLTRAIQGKSLDNKQKLAIAYRLLHTIAFLHVNEVIHRDIKCDNILLDDDMQPVLADYSVAKLFDGQITGESTHTPGSIATVYICDSREKNAPK